MKGLFIKELYMAWKNFRFFFLVSVAFIAMSTLGEGNPFMLTYPAIIGSLLPVSVLSFDEKAGWDRYSLIFPLSRAQLVSSKYLLSLLVSAVTLLTYGLFVLLKLLLQGRAAVDFSLLLSVYLPLLATAMLLPSAFIFPCVFKWGSQKGSLAYYLVIMLVLVLLFLGLQIVKSPDDQLSWYLPFLPMLAAALFYLSWLLSVAIYKEKSF